MVLIGLAAASALAPYLAMHLKSIDPTLPFAIRITSYNVCYTKLLRIYATVKTLTASGKPELAAIAQKLGIALKMWTDTTEWLAANAKTGLGGVLV